MSSLNQKTLNSAVRFDGVGLHTGKKVSIKVLPSEPNTGIIFKRVDLKKNNIIIPNVFNVTNATLCTTISNEFGVTVSTIEHLMGSFYGLGIDNALVEINSGAGGVDVDAAAGKDIDYQGATDVEFNAFGDAAGAFKELEVSGGTFVTVGAL